MAGKSWISLDVSERSYFPSFPNGHILLYLSEPNDKFDFVDAVKECLGLGHKGTPFTGLISVGKLRKLMLDNGQKPRFCYGR